MENIPIDVKEIVQLGGIAVVALGILYILYIFIKEHRNELAESRRERTESYSWFQTYVNENNHEQTDRFKEHTKALVDVTVESTKAMNTVSKNIEINTAVTQKTLEILDQHSRILEKLYDKVNR